MDEQQRLFAQAVAEEVARRLLPVTFQPGKSPPSSLTPPATDPTPLEQRLARLEALLGLETPDE